VSEYISSPGGIITLCLPLKDNEIKVLVFISPVPWEVESAIVTSFISKFVFPCLFESFSLIFSPEAEM